MLLWVWQAEARGLAFEAPDGQLVARPRRLVAEADLVFITTYVDEIWDIVRAGQERLVS